MTNPYVSIGHEDLKVGQLVRVVTIEPDLNVTVTGRVTHVSEEHGEFWVAGKLLFLLEAGNVWVYLISDVK